MLVKGNIMLLVGLRAMLKEKKDRKEEERKGLGWVGVHVKRVSSFRFVS